MQFARKKWFYKRFTTKSKSIKLGLRNLYIFPNLFGFYWLISIIFLYVLGINLEATFTIFISYLMTSVFFISLFLTHFNLHGLELSSLKESYNFANLKINYDIVLKSKKIRSNLKLKFLNKNNKFRTIENIFGNMEISLTSEGMKRGIYFPDTIYGESSSPLSLFNCWFYWKPQNKLIIFPEKKKGKIDYEINNHNEDSFSKDNYNNIGDELRDLKIYVKGEKRSLIHWKSLARTRNLLSKNFANEVLKNNWIILNKNLPLEKALENLSYEIHTQYKANNFYGVRLSKNKFINPGNSKKHYLKSMTMLAGLK